MDLIKKTYRNILDNNNFIPYNKLIKDIKSCDKNFILYGPPDTLKYKNALKIIETFSPSKLKYEKKIIIEIQKNNFIIKISDIHYEVDVELLFYNSKI